MNLDTEEEEAGIMGKLILSLAREALESFPLNIY